MAKKIGKKSGAKQVAKKHVRTKRKLAERVPKYEVAELPRNYEELVVRSLTQAPRKRVERSLQVQDLIYNSAPELRTLAYKSGFNLGAEAYRNSNGGIEALEHLLENGGFGKITYHPQDTVTAFTSYSIKHHGIELHTNVHVFEAGVIAGYLSAHSKLRIDARETHCIFNGSRYCRFEASTPTGVEEEAVMPLESLPNIVRAVQDALLRSEKEGGGNSYYFYSMKPLLKEPLFLQANNFLYLVGKLSVRERLPGPEKAAEMAANFLRIDSMRVYRGKKGGETLRLSYGHEIASAHFVELTTSLISGILRGGNGGEVQVSRQVDRKGIYNVEIKISGKH